MSRLLIRRSRVEFSLLGPDILQLCLQFCREIGSIRERAESTDYLRKENIDFKEGVGVELERKVSLHFNRTTRFCFDSWKMRARENGK